MTQGPSAPAPDRTVHLLVVHGVGGYNHLSNLLRTYQSLRANLRSIEAPVFAEDLIPGWRLVQFVEDATPPVLTLEPRVAPQAGSVVKVCVYEVNYSQFAAVLRQNHRLDLTNLFLGLDLAVCAVRRRDRPAYDPVFGGNTGELGCCLQSVAGVLSAGTVPIVGLPALLFRDYLGTFIATFTRFFEDVATFVLDKNGEQLISSHFDRALEQIGKAMQPDDRLIVAAHSLGSVVAHNSAVRTWTTASGLRADTVITFGSPIGLLTWIWLFLDFERMDFNQRITEDRYFCWNPVPKGAAARRKVAWFNAVNLTDPIATWFPSGAVDLAATPAELQQALEGGDLRQYFFGRDALTAVGAAHSEYLHDKRGFLEIVMRATGLAIGRPEQVETTRSPVEHRVATMSRLAGLQRLLWIGAMAAIVGYCLLVARAFEPARWYGDPRALLFALPFVWPRATMAVLAFFQRLLFGGPTKRIPLTLIRDMPMTDPIALPYRVRDMVLRVLGRARDVDPLAPSQGYAARLAFKALSFVPTLAGMLVPLAGVAWLREESLLPGGSWGAVSAQALGGLALFMFYVGACAAHELVAAWRRVLRAL